MFGEALGCEFMNRTQKTSEVDGSGEVVDSRRRILKQGSATILGFATLFLRPAEASSPEPTKFRAVYSDSVTCANSNTKLYTFGHEVEYDVLTSDVSFVSSITSHKTYTDDYSWDGESTRDTLYQYNDGFEKEAGGKFRCWNFLEVHKAGVDVRVFDNGVAQTEFKFANCGCIG